MQRAIMRSRNTPSYHFWTFSLMDSSLDAPWGISRLFLSPNSHSFIGYMKQKPALVQPMDHSQGPQIKTKRRAKHHGKRNRWCRCEHMVRLITAFDFSPADFKRFLTALADRFLFGNHCHFRIGVFANGTRLHTATFYVVFGSSQVFHRIGWGVFSRKPADYCIVIAHLTSNIFEEHLCWLQADYMPSLRLWYSSWYQMQSTSSQISTVGILNFG
jgi:hypothetical protein